jgi:hypothetical protein
MSTYTLIDLLLNRVDDPVNALPVVFVLRSAADHTKAFKNVDDVVDASPLNPELFSALVQVKHAFAFNAVIVQEPAAEFAQ